jgi:putative endonuclease
MNKNKRDFGKEIEQRAVNYLIEQKYTIITQNYSSQYGEIDIIAGKNDLLVVVEVKYREQTEFGEPEVSVNKSKQSKIIKTALMYVKEHNIKNRSIRFDVISVTPDKINHIENAFISKTFYTY